jgi:hypothetical protein
MNRRSNAKNNGRPKGRKTFDKSEATLVRVEIDGPGTFTVPSAISGHRCWVEWAPRADAPAPDKRLFVGKKAQTDPKRILGQGGEKLPRGGRSLDPDGRTFVALFAGCLKVWHIEPDQGIDQPRAVNGLPADIASPSTLASVQTMIAGGMLGGSAGQIRGPPSESSTPRRRQ